MAQSQAGLDQFFHRLRRAHYESPEGIGRCLVAFDGGSVEVQFQLNAACIQSLPNLLLDRLHVAPHLAEPPIEYLVHRLVIRLSERQGHSVPARCPDLELVGDDRFLVPSSPDLSDGSRGLLFPARANEVIQDHPASRVSHGVPPPLKPLRATSRSALQVSRVSTVIRCEAVTVMLFCCGLRRSILVEKAADFSSVVHGLLPCSTHSSVVSDGTDTTTKYPGRSRSVQFLRQALLM